MLSISYYGGREWRTVGFVIISIINIECFDTSTFGALHSFYPNLNISSTILSFSTTHFPTKLPML